MKDNNISKQTLKRLPVYLNYLNYAKKKGEKNISSPSIAHDLRLNEVQVRKDLALVSSTGGKPRTGYDLETLISDIKIFLGYDRTDKAVLVGAGHLGQALLAYEGYSDYGLEIVAAFDKDEKVVGTVIGGKPVYDISYLTEFVRKNSIEIGVLTVSAMKAQEACDLLVESGIKAIWNFAPVFLSIPEDILLQNENTAASLAFLSMHLREKNGE